MNDILGLVKDIALIKIFKRKVPIRVKHDITYRCNLLCPFCMFKKDLNKPGDEMNTAQIKKMMGEFKEMGTRFWLISGGEPLLREDLAELISYAKDEMNFHCSIATNGTLLAQKIKVWPALKKLDLVQVSLDGPKEIQDKLRGIGTYDKIISALNELKKSGIKTIITVLISKENLGCLEYFIRITREYNMNIAFQASGKRPSAADGLDQQFFPDKEVFRGFIEDLLARKKYHNFIINSFSYLKMLRNFWPDIPHNITCYAGKFSCDVNAQGFIVPCCVKLNSCDDCCNGVKRGFREAFLRLADMSGCRDCYYAGPQELNIIWKRLPFNIISLYKEYCARKII